MSVKKRVRGKIAPLSSHELGKLARRMDRTFGEPFPRLIDGSTRSHHRACVEIAFQLALLNEKLDKSYVLQKGKR